MAGLEGRKVSVIAAEPELLQLNSNAYAYLGAQTFVRSSSAYQSRSNRDLQRTRSMWMETEGLVRVSTRAAALALAPRLIPRLQARVSTEILHSFDILSKCIPLSHSEVSPYSIAAQSCWQAHRLSPASANM